ncbi:helix-turn-helix domain-containing protein [Pseudonocardia humida]|uniref:Helix-turn-helix domain-containing protein n=1 Tax=Pseudonocardia humida TaxID=2800819 RepID=A0ABT1A0J8_9PSEU|nr:helix-turn-helix domain-containing protein [Pseudonocardia humida]MCO1656531.1 helix-turn-helix domain-containing protein [Pseudonocardia humida]
MPQIALELLRLLAQDAPAEQLDASARELAADDPATAAAARELAMRVRAGVDASRRREAELSALVETARELASRSDPGAVLEAIVQRARALVGADVSYLALHDPDRGDTYMRATAGSVSARFQALRLPLGAGLGGLVAQTERPYWTPDYPTDDRYRHTTEIDAAVAEEGLIAICGVPLLVDGAFVGVLFAANRSYRPFRRDEVALLGSLGALAAVSLVQSRRAAEAAAALDALSAAHGGIEQAAAAHDRFTALVLAGGDVADIAAALGEVLGCWVVVLDDEGVRLAGHGAAPAPGEGVDPLAEAPAVRESEGTGRLAAADGLWAVSVTAAGQRLGTVALGGRDALDAGQGRTVERAAMVTALLLNLRMRAAEAERRTRTELLGDLVARPAGATADRDLVQRGKLVGARLTAPHVVAVVHCAPERRRAVAFAAASGAALAAEQGDAVVVLVPGEDASAVADDLARRLGGVEPATVGAAGPVVPARGLAGAHAEARRTADALLALGLPGRGAAAADLGFAGLVIGGERADVDGYLDRVLGPLADYDDRRGSDLVGTLAAWFATGGGHRAAAAELHVHPNTVAQRLGRIGALLGPDWQEPERALELQLALRLRRLRVNG